MGELENLGDALREQLLELVADVNPSAELWTRIDAIPRADRAQRWLGRLWRRRIALGLPVPIAALGVAAALLLSGPTSSLASGVTVLPNGDVRMSLTQLGDVAAANSVLRRHHIYNIVVVPMTASCSYRDMQYDAALPHPSPVNVMTPQTIPAGSIVVMASKQVGPNEVVTATGRFTGHLPRCASTHGWGVGMGTYRSYPPPAGQEG